jgi:hypothetical protein
MKIDILPAVRSVDWPTILTRVPDASHQRVFDAIAAAMSALPVDANAREELQHGLRGLYKCKFSSGLEGDEKDMRLAVFLDEETDTAVVWAVGFRDAYLPTDFYQMLSRRVTVERGLGTRGSSLVGKAPNKRGRTR